jgi:NADH-quinone oxidoreductase subunit F
VNRTVLVCRGTGCIAGAEKIFDALVHEVKASGLNDVKVDFSGCHGFCQRGPIVVIEPEGYFYTEVQSADAAEIVRAHLVNNQPVERLFYHDTETGKPVSRYSDVPFYAKQHRVILRNCGRINPERIEDYLAAGGYKALKRALTEMTPDTVIDEVKRSGLRGRGGAGFPTGQKWEFCRRAPGDVKYMICNADEGDPGAFMDRSILEADPHSVLEGMMIAAYAIGANHGYIYCRAEYPLAIERLNIALKQLTEHKLLGNNILGSSFNLHLEVKEGAGAFVCGEETAMMESIEGKRGMPRPRPPFPATKGLWGMPTTINNVKTLVSAGRIIEKGAAWFTGIGTEGSPGTAVFALTGKIQNSGLIEVPMGTPLEHIIFGIGGGIIDGKRFKAVQTGGPSGGCLPADLLRLPVEYENLTKAGSMMGSGGMVVVDEETCMVDMARFFLSFTQAESCGKCVSCRVGTRQMLSILERITSGEGKLSDIKELEQLSQVIKSTSLCGLGQTAPNPVLTTLRYFRHEYEAHINEKRCPSLVCTKLTNYYIIPDKCEGCMICMRNCPVEVIAGGRRLVHIINQEKCTKCGSCLDVCPKKFGAVIKMSGEKIDVPNEPVPVVTSKSSK